MTDYAIIEKTAYLLLAAVLTGVFAFCSFPVAISVASAATLMLVNLSSMRFIFGRYVLGEGGPSLKSIPLFVAKILLLFLAAYLCMKYLPLNTLVFGISLGASMMVYALLAACMAPKGLQLH